MPCEHIKDALVQAAALGAPLQDELRAHLAECASCRETFTREQSLFATIDAGLYAATNAEVPPGLLPRVRANLDEAAAPRLRWLQPLVFASASVALAIAFTFMVWTHHTTPEDNAKQSPAPPAPVTPKRSTPASVPPSNAQTVSIPAGHSHATRNSTFSHPAASSNPEVLVPPDEGEAFARLVATLNERGNVAAGLLAPALEKKDALVSVDPLQIADIEIKPLESGQTEISNGTGEKR